MPEHPTDPGAEEADGHGGCDIEAGFGPVVLLDELEGLQAEGGEGGEAAAESGDDEKCGGGFALVNFPEAGGDANGERAEEVGGESAEGKRFKSREADRQSVTAEAAECAPECYAKPSHARDVHAQAGFGESFRCSILSWGGEGLADDDADGAGGNPVGRVGGIAPDPIAGGVDPASEGGIPHCVCGALVVVEPYEWIHVIVAEGSVDIRAGTDPSGG